MQVEIDVPNPNYHLQPGMYANVTLMAGQQANALTVPIGAIQRGQNSSTVLVVDARNRVQQREVRTGIEDSNRVEILSGLSEGDRVISGNVASFREGQLVQPKQSAPLSAGANSE